MPRRMSRKALSLRPVVSNKESVDGVFLAVAAGVTTTMVLATSVNDYGGAVGDCPQGSSIRSLYLEVSYSEQAITPTNFDWFLAKNPGSQLTLPVPGSVGGNTNRKWVFHESKGLAPNEENASPSKKAGWIKIPGKYFRMGENDQLVLRARGASQYNLCVKCIYKWFA